MFQDTSRKTVSLVLPIVGMSLAVALYGAPPWPVLPLLGGISLFWWGSNRSGDSKARAASTRRYIPTVGRVRRWDGDFDCGSKPE